MWASFGLMWFLWFPKVVSETVESFSWHWGEQSQSYSPAASIGRPYATWFGDVDVHRNDSCSCTAFGHRISPVLNILDLCHDFWFKGHPYTKPWSSAVACPSQHMCTQMGHVETFLWTSDIVCLNVPCYHSSSSKKNPILTQKNGTLCIPKVQFWKLVTGPHWLKFHL